MNDAEKIIEALEKALIEENMVGLVLKQLEVRTGLSREKVKISLNNLKNEYKIVESDLTTDSSTKTSRKIYILKEGFDMMKEYFIKEYHDKGSINHE
ncbi:MAG: hypothetical protein ACXQTM_02525 [Methanosarcinales archaeon]